MTESNPDNYLKAINDDYRTERGAFLGMKLAHRYYRTGDRGVTRLARESCLPILDRYFLTPDRELSVSQTGGHYRVADKHHSLSGF